MANEEVLELQIRDNAAEAGASLSQLADALTRVKEAVGKGLHMKGTVTALENLKTAVSNGLSEEAVSRWERLASVLTELKNIGGIKITGMKNVAEQLNASETLQGMKEEAQDVMQTAIEAGETLEVEPRSRIESLKESATRAFGTIKDTVEKAFDDAKGSFDGLGEAFLGLKEKITSLLGDFKRIAKYRFMRSVIKQITEAFTTGVKNVYQWSKAMGGSFADSMDHAATSLLQFKNSIGAAVAPLIQSILPYIEQLISWLIEGINYLNQFLSLLRGQSSWTRAIRKSVNAFDDQKKAAKGAAKALKELLADWDELNIIQSETGGGSGSGGLSNAEDYLNMFVEETEFSNYLKDNFDSILNTVKLIGAGLLAWKFSSLFTGIIGDLMTLVALGALITIGTKLSYEGGFSAGSKGYFDTGDILKSVGGAIADAVGGGIIGYMVAGPGGAVVGVAVGLTVGVIATLIGWVEGQADLMDREKWGNLTMTHDEIEQFVADQFSFDAVAKIKLYNAQIINQRGAKAHLNSMIDEFTSSLKTAQISAEIDIDSDTASLNVQNAYADAVKAIEAVQGLLNASDEGVNVVLKDFKFENAGGEDVSGDIMDSISISNTSLREYFTGLGADLAKVMLEGEKSGWKNGEKEAALELMASQQRILDEARKKKAEITLETKMGSIDRKIDKDTVMDRETATAVMQEQQQALEEYSASAREAINEEIDGLNTLAALAESAAEEEYRKGNFEVAAELFETAKDYKDDAIKLIRGMDEAIDSKLAETRANMASAWAETLKMVYGGDFDSQANVSSKVLEGYNYDGLLSYIPQGFDKNLPKYIQSGDIEKAGEALYNGLKEGFKAADPNGIVGMFLDDLNGNAYELLSEDAKKTIMRNLVDATGGDVSLASEIFQSAFQIPTIRDVLDYIPTDEVKGAAEEIVSDVADTINEVADGVKPVIKIGGAELLVDDTGLMEQLKQQIEEAVSNDGRMSDEEKRALLETFGERMYKQALDELSYSFDEQGLPRGWLGRRQLASAGMNYSDVGKGANVVIPYTGAYGNDEQMSADMERGVRNGNEPQNELIRTMVSQLERLNNKQWSVNVYPNSTWGATNARSEEAYRRVTG